jgi:hypothetical protein
VSGLLGVAGIAGIAGIVAAGSMAREERRPAGDIVAAAQTVRSAPVTAPVPAPTDRPGEPAKAMPIVVSPPPVEPVASVPLETRLETGPTPAAPRTASHPVDLAPLKEEARAALARLLAEAEADAVMCARNAGMLLGYEPNVLVVTASVRPPSTRLHLRGSSPRGQVSALAEAEQCLLKALRARRVEVPIVAVSETRRYEL